jgi:hypothetical protein
VSQVETWNNENTGRMYAEALTMTGHPGKFEGEPAWTPYFWLRMMDGDGDNLYSDEFGGGYVEILDVNEFERRLMDLPPGTVAYILEGSGSGFVSGGPLTAEQERQEREHAEKRNEQESYRELVRGYKAEV